MASDHYCPLKNRRDSIDRREQCRSRRWAAPQGLAAAALSRTASPRGSVEAYAAGRPVAVPFDDRYEGIDRHDDPDLGRHGVLGGAVATFDAQMLFRPLEERLDLPAALAQRADSERGQQSVIGQGHPVLVGLGVAISEAPQLRDAQGNWTPRASGGIADQSRDLAMVNDAAWIVTPTARSALAMCNSPAARSARTMARCCCQSTRLEHWSR